MATRSKARFAVKLAALAVMAYAPIVAIASCAQWNVGGAWSLTQSNDQRLSVSLRQEGGTLTGTAKWPQLVKNAPVLGIVQRGDDVRFNDGSVDGVVNGDRIDIQIYWTGGRGAVGVYTGRIGPQGRIEGQTYNRQNPSDQATWFSDTTMDCAVQASGAPPADRPARRLGKVRPAGQPADVLGSVAEATQGATAVAGAADSCRSGYVWREAGPRDRVCVPPAARTRAAAENRAAVRLRDPAGAYGPDTCISGYVWREAFEGDVACVTPSARQQAREENGAGASRRAGG